MCVRVSVACCRIALGVSPQSPRKGNKEAKIYSYIFHIVIIIITILIECNLRKHWLVMKVFTEEIVTILATF